MAEEEFRVFELTLQGFGCSQILAILALEARGEQAPSLVRAMSGLLGGCHCSKTCGTLTGGCCVLGLYAGRGGPDEPEHQELPEMVSELVEWFEDEFGARHGGTDCASIAGKHQEYRASRCPPMIVDTFRQMREILAARGIGMDGRPTADRA